MKRILTVTWQILFMLLCVDSITQISAVMSMKAGLVQKLLEYVETIEGGVVEAVDFTADQAPLVIQEFLSWMFIENISIFVIACLLTAVNFYIFKKVCDWVTKENVWNEIGPLPLMVLFPFLFIARGDMVRAWMLLRLR